MSRIEPPPGPWTWTEALVLAAACATLQRIHGRGTLSAIATLSEDEYDTWSAAVRLHRDAWRHHLNGLRGEAQTAIDRVNHADEAFTEQGRAVGWLHEHPSTYTTPTVPIIHADEAADTLLTVLGPRDARQWSWELARAVREHTRARLN